MLAGLTVIPISKAGRTTLKMPKRAQRSGGCERGTIGSSGGQFHHHQSVEDCQKLALSLIGVKIGSETSGQSLRERTVVNSSCPSKISVAASVTRQ